MNGFDAAVVTIPSRFGEHILVWRDLPEGPRVVRVILSPEGNGAEAVQRRLFPCAIRRSHHIIERLCRQVQAFLQGQPVRFSLDILDLEACPAFQQRVLRAEAKIPRGRVSTYGRLARRIRAPGAARAVGTALARNPFPLIIPCHRCIREDGQLGGFRGGQPMKRALLELEGIGFDGRGRIKREFIW